MPEASRRASSRLPALKTLYIILPFSQSDHDLVLIGPLPAAPGKLVDDGRCGQLDAVADRWRGTFVRRTKDKKGGVDAGADMHVEFSAQS
jgi:hypothetical protein